MNTIVLIEQNGTVKQIKTKDVSRETLYKKCGFRSAENFDKMTAWEIEQNKEMVSIELWAKTDGKANNENKYDFPPPVDNDLYYGTCCLIMADSKGRILNLTSEMWLKLYEKLFGGFEELDEEDTEDEDEEDEEDEEEEDEDEEEVPKIKKTKNGYLKDDFVVEDEDDSENDSEEGGEVCKPVTLKKTTPVAEEEEDYYGSELEEETYSYSDED